MRRAILFYSAEPLFFDEQEISLLDQLAVVLAYAVESLQLDEQLPPEGTYRECTDPSAC